MGVTKCDGGNTKNGLYKRVFILVLGVALVALVVMGLLGGLWGLEGESWVGLLSLLSELTRAFQLQLLDWIQPKSNFPLFHWPPRDAQRKGARL